MQSLSTQKIFSYELGKTQFNLPIQCDEDSIYETKKKNDPECEKLLLLYKERIIDNYNFPSISEQIEQDINLFGGAYFEKVVYIKMPVESEKSNNLEYILHFVNGYLLDPKKLLLQKRPLKFIGNTINSYPIKNFLMETSYSEFEKNTLHFNNILEELHLYVKSEQ